jgi:hypothetical protein
MKHDVAGFQLHPIDLAINKLLALAGRNEPRDFLDIMEVHRQVLALGRRRCCSICCVAAVPCERKTCSACT